MTRTRTALTFATLGLAGLLGLTACSASPQAASLQPAPLDLAAVADEAYALQAVGLEAAPSPAPSGSAQSERDKGDRRHAPLRRQLRKNTLHGEVTVQGKEGTRTIVVQRGTVTAAEGKTVSVKSTDGFTRSWTLGEKLRVVQNKKKVDTAALKTGAKVGLAGIKDGNTSTARLAIME